MIKLIKNSIGQYKKYAIIAPLLVLLEVIIEVSIPLMMTNITDNLGVTSELVKWGSILLVMAGVSLSFGVISGKLSAIASAGFAANLRKDLYTNIQQFSFKDIDQFSNSSLVTRLTTDVTNIQNSFGMLIRIAIRVPMLLIMSIVMAFVVSPQMAMYFVIVMPILAFGFFLVVRKAFPIFDKIFPKYDALNQYVQENIKGIRVVKTFATEDVERAKFDLKAKAIQTEFTKAEKIVSLTSPMMTAAIFTIQLLLYGFGAHLIVSTSGIDLTTGQLQSLIIYSTTMLMALMMLMMIIVMISMSRTNARRVLEVLTYVPTMNSSNEVKEINSGDIEFINVNFKYKEQAEKNTLDNINLKIKSGSQIGIIGATGSGKSSLVNLIPRLYDISEGRVLVDGVDVDKYDLTLLRDNVAVVLQKNVLFSGTIKENLLWGNEFATDEEIKQACDNACCSEFIAKFPDGLETMIDQGGTNVSGGQKQRLCIARALLKNPKILILDDSTSAVDTKTDMMINQSFKEGLKDTTKLIISQRISSIQNCDAIIVMDEGKINQVDTHDNLVKTNEIYKEIYDVQMRNKSTEEDGESNE